ncbi:HAD family hydrolase [Leifsonia sp. AG29]|uniref:HAD family hydrolase n=1 Tax=Leifsonia sp. AG29 TaxID=2598860 RepID=UPI00131D600C|nr:HAD family hydrolase [Leifsonia sp. AG29]
MTPDGLITSEFDDAAIIDPVARRRDDEWHDGEDEPDDDDLVDLELVVFDLIGALVADDGLTERAFAVAAATAGLGRDATERHRATAYFRSASGQSTLSVFRALAGDEDQAQHANAVFESSYADLAATEGLRPLAGAEELVERLQDIGVRVAIATGFSRATLDAVLDALDWRDLADVTLTPAEAGRGRPYPDLALAALLRTGASSVESMVVVGSTTSDVASGAAAGAGLVVGVLGGAHDERALLAAGADAVISSVAELPELLGQPVIR